MKKNPPFKEILEGPKKKLNKWSKNLSIMEESIL